jgi:uncharacterized membrane-anchored protein
MRNVVLWSVLAIVLVAANGSIFRKEQVLANGETMLLPLAPRDPRSLLQGDYMTLRYAIAQQIADRLGPGFSVDGVAVVSVDENDVVNFVRIEQGQGSLAAGERLLRFRKRGESLRIAGDAFFFEEGRQALFADARFGELKVDPTGEAVLVGLRDADFDPLGPR